MTRNLHELRPEGDRSASPKHPISTAEIIETLTRLRDQEQARAEQSEAIGGLTVPILDEAIRRISSRPAMFNVIVEGGDTAIDVEDFIGYSRGLFEDTEIEAIRALEPGETIIVGGPGVLSVTRDEAQRGTK
jgi:hypothetical protein